MLSAIACALLAASPTVDGGDVPSPLVEPPARAAPPASRPHLGLQLDVGFPEGAGAALAFGPWHWLRLELGAAHNGAATGIRGGLTLSLFRTVVRPTLSAHAGHFPKGDLRPIARVVGAGDALASPIFSSVQYDFVSAQLGVEIGAPNGVSAFARGGISRPTARFLAAQEALREASGDPTLTASPLVLSFLAPSIQVGLSTPLL
jgi:hypothetical protein